MKHTSVASQVMLLNLFGTVTCLNEAKHNKIHFEDLMSYAESCSAHDSVLGPYQEYQCFF